MFSSSSKTMWQGSIYWLWFPCGHITCALTLCALSACRLRYSAKGFLTIGGFSEPSDADADDIELWMPTLPCECNVCHSVFVCPGSSMMVSQQDQQLLLWLTLWLFW